MRSLPRGNRWRGEGKWGEIAGGLKGGVEISSGGKKRAGGSQRVSRGIQATEIQWKTGAAGSRSGKQRRRKTRRRDWTKGTKSLEALKVKKKKSSDTR